MFSPEIYTERRKQLKSQLSEGVVLFLGNNDVGMNYKGNTYHFRQDSNFLYFFGIDIPGLAAVIDLEDGSETVFGDDLTIEDVVWTGPQPSVAELSRRSGIAKSAPAKDLDNFISVALEKGRTVHFTPPYRHENMIRLNDMLGIPVPGLKQAASLELIRAIIAQRAHKAPEEIAEMEKAVNVSGAMHVAAMRAADAGKIEAELAGIVQGIAISFGGDLAYPAILTIDGQTLHNHFHGHVLKEGDLVLGDFGAETALHYAGDLTRTFPVSRHFSNQQKEIYEIVLEAETTAIKALRPGIPYRAVHLMASKVIASGLKNLGLMQGDVDEAVAQGAHAMFFPHGLGHMIGLDVHDMEDLGEDHVGYSDTVKRSDQFGTAYLRLGRELKPGFVLTVEPGIYFIPELIEMWRSAGKFKDFINYEKVEPYKDFGGIRIEDNVLITSSGHQVLGSPVPKTVAEVEQLRQG